MTITDEKLKELKVANPDVVVLATRSGDEVAVKPPSEAVYMRWQTTGKAGTAEAYASTRQFLFDCTVFPDKSTLDSLLERRPALLQVFVRQLTKMAGAEEEIEVRK